MSTVLHVKGLEGSPQNIFLLPLHIRKLPLPWLWIKTQRCLGEHYDSAQHHPATWISFEQKRTFNAALIFLCKQVFLVDPKWKWSKINFAQNFCHTFPPPLGWRVRRYQLHRTRCSRLLPSHPSPICAMPWLIWCKLLYVDGTIMSSHQI